MDVESGSSETNSKKESKIGKRNGFAAFCARGHRSLDCLEHEDEEKGQESRATSGDANKNKKDRVKPIAKRSKKISSTSEVDSSSADKTVYCSRLETKLKWAVDEVGVNSPIYVHLEPLVF